MTLFSRRRFLQSALLSAAAVHGKATDWVTLGRSGVKATRLAFGTGTFGGRVQRQLGQDEFTRLVRYAYDHGIRFFETAESYGEMHKMLGIALQGIPRDTYRLMSKVTTRPETNPLEKIDELRKLANTDYFDILLLHNQRVATWPTDSLRWQDGLLEAKQKHAIIGHGASVHGLPALRQFASNNWLEVALMRVNHNGTRMDAENYASREPGNVPEVVTHMKAVHAKGIGVIGMKLIGEGAFTNREDRRAAMRFAFQNAGVDCVTVGYKSTAEIDEAIENLNLALA